MEEDKLFEEYKKTMEEFQRHHSFLSFLDENCESYKKLLEMDDAILKFLFTDLYNSELSFFFIGIIIGKKTNFYPNVEGNMETFKSEYIKFGKKLGYL